ncbi:MAG: TrmH family RNA methyltransferase [Oligoflexus sp.]
MGIPLVSYKSIDPCFLEGSTINHIIQYVDDPHDPRLTVFSERKDHILRQQQLIIVDSDKVVLRMMEGGYRILKLLLTQRFLRVLEAGHWQLAPDVEIYLGDKPVVESIVGHRIHHGVIALAERPVDFPLADLGNKLVILNGVISSENIGAIARSCHAFGFTGLIADQYSCSPWVRRSIRVSMGSVFSLKMHHTGHLLQVIANLRQHGFAIYGSGIVPQSVSSKGFVPQEKFAFILGSEGEGMQQEIMDACDLMLQIPVHTGIDSLNVSVASGILLYELGCRK